MVVNVADGSRLGHECDRLGIPGTYALLESEAKTVQLIDSPSY